MLSRSEFPLSVRLALLVLFMHTAGCNHVDSEKEALKKSLAVNGVSEQNVVLFSGAVTVDSQPLVIERGSPLFVMAYDVKNPPKGRQLPFTTICDKSGHFQFNTYGTGDGLPAGSYIVLFAQPKATGGDGLKNLYNDPDLNAKDERFQINLSSPGKTDWAFDLAVAGKDPITTPGARAVKASPERKKRG
jgi:hypothetical protein